MMIVLFSFIAYRNVDISMKDRLTYGNSLVVLLCGKPGEHTL